MKLVLAIISNDDSKRVIKNLVQNSFYATKLATTGGFLMNGNTTILVGCEDDEVDKVKECISQHAKSRDKLVSNSLSSEYGLFDQTPIKVKVGGATIFVLEVTEFLKI